MDSGTTEQREAPPSVLARAVGILDAFAGRSPHLTLAELSEAAGLPRSTTHRMASDLALLGLLDHVDGGYRLGPHLFDLGLAAGRSRDLRVIARPFMEDLCAVTGGRTVHLVVLDGVHVVPVEVVRGAGAGRMSAPAVGPLHAHACAAGKAILALSPPDVVQARVDAGLVRVTARTIVSPGALARELSGVRTSGVAMEREESGVGELAVASPVTVGAGPSVAALSLGGLSQPDMSVFAPAVRLAATSLSRTLGTFVG